MIPAIIAAVSFAKSASDKKKAEDAQINESLKGNGQMQVGGGDLSKYSFNTAGGLPNKI